LRAAGWILAGQERYWPAPQLGKGCQIIRKGNGRAYECRETPSAGRQVNIMEAAPGAIVAPPSSFDLRAAILSSKDDFGCQTFFPGADAVVWSPGDVRVINAERGDLRAAFMRMQNTHATATRCKANDHTLGPNTLHTVARLISAKVSGIKTHLSSRGRAPRRILAGSRSWPSPSPRQLCAPRLAPP